MPQPSIAIVGGLGVCKFGNSAMPNGQSTWRSAVQADSPVAWWRLGDSPSSLTAVDSAGTFPGTFTGTCVRGMPSAVNDQGGSIFVMTTGSFVTIPYNASLAPTPNFSIEAWFYPSVILGGSALAIFDATRVATTGFGLFFTNTGAVQGAVGTGAGLTTLTSSAVSVGAWHHAVLTYDGTNARLYVDGALVAGPTATAYSVNPTAALRIGGGQGGGVQLQGFVDEVAIYSTVLSAARVTAHYNAAFSWQNLNDAKQWLVQRIGDSGGWDYDTRILEIAPYVYRSRGAYISDDWGPLGIRLPLVYYEGTDQGGAGQPLGQQLASIAMAGEQNLTFDNATALPVKLRKTSNRKLLNLFSPFLWGLELDFLSKSPWWVDLLPTVGTAVTVAGTTGGSVTSFNVTYPGSVWAEPIYIFSCGSANTATISQIVLTNAMTGESLTLTFTPVLAGGAWMIVMDSSKMQVLDQTGKLYDFTGSFPVLQGPAGQVNPFTCKVTTGTGTLGGTPALQQIWTNRWML